MIRVKAYLNEPDSNYETYVSVLLAARLADKRMLIRLEGSKTSGFCDDTWTILLSNKAAEVQYSTLLFMLSFAKEETFLRRQFECLFSSMYFKDIEKFSKEAALANVQFKFVTT